MPNTVSISEKPWSDYTSADYSIEQWHDACLIHQHNSSPTSKSQCKLPIKTPSGTLNRNGVHAAAAALAGARGGVNASPEEKTSAMKQIRGAYSKLGEKPPPSMMQSEELKEFLSHSEKSRTIQDVLDENKEQRDLIDLIVGAAVENVDISGETAIVSKYDALSAEKKHVINFIVGAAIADPEVVKHEDPVAEFMAHFGVKGMHWGIRNDDGPSSVNSSGLKSVGHRIANSVLGDKTFWSRTARIAGYTAGGIAVSHALPGVLPVAAVVYAGELGLNSAYGQEFLEVTANITGDIPSIEEVGKTVITTVGIAASVGAGASAELANYASSIVRALRNQQSQGLDRVKKITGIRHSDEDGGHVTTKLETFFKDQGLRSLGTLAHYGIRGMHWGIRRSDAQLARAGGPSADAIRAKETLSSINKSGSLSAVSDSDLNHLLSRINLEKRYSDAVSPRPTSSTSSSSTIKKVFSVVNPHPKVKTLLAVGDTMNKAIEFSRSPAGKIIASKLKKAR